MKLTALMMIALPMAALAQTPAPRTATETSADPLDKVTCKRFTQIGSLIASKKECKTKRDWDAERQEAQRRLHDCSASGSGGGSAC